MHVCAVYSLLVCKLMLQFRPTMVCQNSNTNFPLVHLDQVFVVSCATALSICKIVPCIICAVHASSFQRHASQGASLVARVCCGGKSAIRLVQTSYDKCVGVESNLRWVQDRAQCVFSIRKSNNWISVRMVGRGGGGAE